MRSRTSRGVPEWSGGKDLYMESCCSGSGKGSGFFGIVPGSFQKVPEDSGGVRRSGNCSTTSNTVAWAVGGALALMGQGQQPPQGPCAWEGENPKGGGLHLTWEALLPPWPHPLGWETLKGAQPPSPLYILEVLGLPTHEFSPSWCSPTSLPTPPLPWCLAKPCRIATLLHHHHAVVLLLDGVFLNLSLSPCWIKAWETSPGCTCVERGGAVRSALGSPVI